MYDNWINKLTESYLKTRLGINEEEGKSEEYHPMVHKAADFIHSKLDKHYAKHPKVQTLKTIHNNLGDKEVNRDNVVDASIEAIHDHYGIEGHSYDVNDTVGGDHSEHPRYEQLIDNAVENVEGHLWDHLGENDKK
jgi:hypothetical protein